MKKIAFILLTVVLFSTACNKNQCWIIVDCVGNDLQEYCGSKNDVESYCASHNPPGCTWTYRKE